LLYLALHALTVSAQDDSKLEAAMRLHKAMMVADAPNLADAFANSLIAQFGGDAIRPEIQDEMKAFVLEIVESQEYAQAKAQIYAQHLPLEVIEAMTDLVETQEYEQYMSVLPRMTEASGLLMLTLLDEKQDELQSRLQAIWDGLQAP
jgi:hypothetical protein